MCIRKLIMLFPKTLLNLKSLIILTDNFKVSKGMRLYTLSVKQ